MLKQLFLGERCRALAEECRADLIQAVDQLVAAKVKPN
jgi:hypothetical protein